MDGLLALDKGFNGRNGDILFLVESLVFHQLRKRVAGVLEKMMTWLLPHLNLFRSQVRQQIWMCH